jgi:aspartyl-tRNA(Asn)/glutamyl-tRNA(Gln) amidotransferase subunit A
MISPYSSLAELSRALRKKDVSSVELTEMYLGRLKTLGREHRAVAELTEEHALRQARRADSTEFKHPLHGIPFGAKDLLATKGIPTRWGSGAHADQVFNHDATAIEKLYDAGGVLVAKLAMIALAGGGDYNNANASVTGACLCAWDKKRWAGGSSSGSGAATALGCVGYSLGSETSGSITCPSAFNGLTGFRPTYGRVSRHGAMALCWTLDKVGPMARSAEDCALVLQTIAGYDPRDRSTLTQRLSLRPRGKKPVIGLLKEGFNSRNQAGKRAYDDAIAELKKLGYEFVDVAYPQMPYGLAVGLIVDAEGASAHEHLIRDPERLKKAGDANQTAGLTVALDTKAVDYLWAMRLRTEALKANEIWEKCDAIFTPVFYKASLPADKPFSETWRDMGGDGGPANLLGWPAMAFPIGFEDGAPLGGQIIAPALREDVCYRVVREFQRSTDWHLKRPPVG